jgi:hypothetical protein
MPELDQFLPIFLLISLHGHPVFLIVHETADVRLLQADDALMIVHR